MWPHQINKTFEQFLENGVTVICDAFKRLGVIWNFYKKNSDWICNQFFIIFVRRARRNKFLNIFLFTFYFNERIKNCLVKKHKNTRIRHECRIQKNAHAKISTGSTTWRVKIELDERSVHILIMYCSPYNHKFKKSQLNTVRKYSCS